MRRVSKSGKPAPRLKAAAVAPTAGWKNLDALIGMAQPKRQEHPFVLPQFPVGVKPDKGSGLAMDDVAGLNDLNQWAMSAMVAGMTHEGISFPGYPLLAQFAQRPEYRRMSETIARHMTRKWIKIKSKGGEDADQPEEAGPLAPADPEKIVGLSAASRAGIKPRIAKLGALLAGLGRSREGEEALASEPAAKSQDAKAEKIKQIEAEFDRLDLKTVFNKAAELDGFFGRGHIFLEIAEQREGEELETGIGNGDDAVTKAKVSQTRRLTRVCNVEPVWCYPSGYNSRNPLDPSWYKPEKWFVMSQEVHHTRLLTIVSRQVPDILKPAYAFGGLSLSQIAKPYVDNWLKTRDSVAKIISAFSVFILKTNIHKQMGDTDAAMNLIRRLQLFNLHRDNTGVMALDKDTEEFANVSASLGTLDVLQAQTQEHMAAVSGIPLVELLGITPSGLNASSEGEIETFFDWIHSCQESMFRKPLTVIFNLVQLSLFGEIDENLTFDFEPLRTMDEKEIAEIQQIKANMLADLVDAAIIDQDEARERLAADEDSDFADLDLTKAMEPPAPGPEDALGGDFGGPGGNPPDMGSDPPADAGDTPRGVKPPKVAAVA